MIVSVYNHGKEPVARMECDKAYPCEYSLRVSKNYSIVAEFNNKDGWTHYIMEDE